MTAFEIIGGLACIPLGIGALYCTFLGFIYIFFLRHFT